MTPGETESHGGDTARMRCFYVLSYAALICCLLGACDARKEQSGTDAEEPQERTRIVLKVQPLWGDPGPFRALLAEFERAHPDVEVVPQLIANSSDLTHQFYLTALEGGADDFDVLAVDVVWVPEFARAGWIADLSDTFPPRVLQEQLLPGPVESVLVEGRTFAVPWFLDVGLLYYRTDLVPRAPRTYDELRQFARQAVTKHPGLYGYLWQGRQYEGLTCNVYEAIWGHGGATFDDGRLALDAPAARRALHYLRGLVTSGISPSSVTSATEEESRRLFQDGRAVFMRNWPYAWKELDAENSKVRGRVAVVPLPSETGEPGAGVLGGWQLAINAHAKPSHRDAAKRLIAHLTSLDANVRMAVSYARIPPRRDAYASPELLAKAPFIASLLPAVERARPRPVTPYYVLLADIVQGELSAAVAGVRSPELALSRAQRLADHLTAEGR